MSAPQARTHSAVAPLLERRSFLVKGALSAGALALLAGARYARADDLSPAQDAVILNSALSAEHEAVAAYQLGAESGLLRPATLKLAIQFQDHHKQHVDALSSTIQSLGGDPVGPLARYEFPVDKLRQESDVLQFAADLERGAVSAYLGAVPLFAERDLSKTAASILGDEAMHWAILRQALGQDPVPFAFVS